MTRIWSITESTSGPMMLRPNRAEHHAGAGDEGGLASVAQRPGDVSQASSTVTCRPPLRADGAS